MEDKNLLTFHSQTISSDGLVMGGILLVCAKWYGRQTVRD